MAEHASTETALDGDESGKQPAGGDASATGRGANGRPAKEAPNLVPSGTDATGGASDTTTDYTSGKIQGG